MYLAAISAEHVGFNGTRCLPSYHAIPKASPQVKTCNEPKFSLMGFGFGLRGSSWFPI